MKIDAKIKFQEEYLPTKRHRIPRIREVTENVTVELREISRKYAPLAMIVSDYKSFVDESGKDQFDLVDTPILAVGEQLYKQKRDMSGALDRGPYTLDAFLKDHIGRFDRFARSSREEALSSLHDLVDSHILIDGELYEESGEPCYVVNTFGLGNNHGGTAMFIEYRYTPNINSTNYFTALQRDEAIAYCNEVAARRGDTKSIGVSDVLNIQVMMPEMVRRIPHVEHVKPSLDEKIESAANRSSNLHSSAKEKSFEPEP